MTEEEWKFEGPAGHFVIPRELLEVYQAQLENLLKKCGFVVEWREK